MGRNSGGICPRKKEEMESEVTDTLFKKGIMSQTCGVPVEGNIDIESIKEVEKIIGNPPPEIIFLVNKYLPPGTVMVSEDVFL